MAYHGVPISEFDTDSGRYAPGHVRASPTPKKGGRLKGFVFLTALLASGIVLTIVHHLFNRHLDGKSLDAATNELPPFLRNQAYVSFIGTTIAHGVRIAFSMAIGVTFGQYFWTVLRSKSHTIAQIDALVNCGQSPFSLSGLRAMTASFSLFLISLLAAATAIIVVLSPGALTVHTNVQRSTPCSVPSVPQSVMTVDHYVDFSHFPIDSAIMDILASNTYMVPFQGDLGSVCSAGLECAYNITFTGPAAQCNDVTNRSNTATAASAYIYMGTSDSPGTLNMTMYDTVKNERTSTSCFAHNATYEVGVEGNPPTLRVWNVTLNDALTFSAPIPFMLSYAWDAFLSLRGNVIAQANGYVTNDGSYNTAPEVNQFFQPTSTGQHTFTMTGAEFASSFLQNVTLSLLSGNIAYNLTGSVDAASNLPNVDSTCAYAVTVYQYDPKRLLATDGGALAVTLVIVFFGCCLLVTNGREENVSFADIIHIALNDQLFAVSQVGELDEKTPVYLETSGHTGRLLPVKPVVNVHAFDTPSQSSSSLAGKKDFYPYRDLPSVPSRSKGIKGVLVEAVLLILATIICALLQHVYYSHLNGKVPTSNLEPSSWYLNQEAVSDIGTALSYLGQVFLAIAISSACVQLLWRSIRDRGHPISQIDALMKVNANPLSLPIFSALGASFAVPIVALLAASTTVVSIFAPGAIKVNPGFFKTGDCPVLAPRNLSNILAPANTIRTYFDQNAAILSMGTYFPPAVSCEALPGSPCSYDLEFIGPGFSCENVTATANYTDFANVHDPGEGGPVNLFQAKFMNQTDELRMVLFVGTWDIGRQEFQAVNCTGVERKYSVTLSRSVTTTGTINVTNNDIVDIIRGNVSSASLPTSFEEFYMYSMMQTLTGLDLELGNGLEAIITPPTILKATYYPAAFAFGSGSGGIGAFGFDGNITWQTNMTSALEALAQNVTLSLLSNKFFNYNTSDSNILENSTTTCRYTGPAYEYTPFPLLVTYGAALAVAVVCSVWGAAAIILNGWVAESVEFSRVLKGLMNGRMYNARMGLDERTRVRAEEGSEGALVPTF